MQQARKQLPQEGEEDWDAGHSSAQLHQQGVPPAPAPLPSPFGEGMSTAPRGSVQQMMAQMQMQQHQHQQGCEGQASARNPVQRQQQLIDLNDLALLVDFAQVGCKGKEAAWVGCMGNAGTFLSMSLAGARQPASWASGTCYVQLHKGVMTEQE